LKAPISAKLRKRGRIRRGGKEEKRKRKVTTTAEIENGTNTIKNKLKKNHKEIKKKSM
jgi:hypothetical protein